MQSALWPFLFRQLPDRTYRIHISIQVNIIQGKFITNAREALIQLVNNHWERLAGGLKAQELQGDLFSSDKRMRRAYHHHELRRLRLETELHWLRRALSLIRNLRDFQEYLEGNGHRPSDTSNHRLNSD
jgi:hypothetical protein